VFFNGSGQVAPFGVYGPYMHSFDRTSATWRYTMGIFDKAKELADQAGDMVDKAKDAVADHGDKLPGDLGDKAESAVEAVENITDKIPGQG
jgi:hypothetical protein